MQKQLLQAQLNAKEFSAASEGRGDIRDVASLHTQEFENAAQGSGDNLLRS